MTLEITEREREGIPIIGLKGRIMAGPEAGALREKVSALSEHGAAKLVFDLKDVNYIDSTGLSALVISASALRKRGGNIKLLNLNRRNIELLVMIKLANIFEIFTEEQDAVNSYFPGREIRTYPLPLRFCLAPLGVQDPAGAAV